MSDQLARIRLYGKSDVPGVPQETRKTLLGAVAPRSVFRVRWAPGVKVKVREPLGYPWAPGVKVKVREG